jgi:M6 family metalloprotease-like protein
MVATHRIPTTLLILILMTTCAYALTDEERAEAVAKNAADRLGWPAPVLSAESAGKSYVISADGLGDDSDIKGVVSVMGSDVEVQMYMSFFEQWDMTRTSYQGRDSVVLTAGKNCDPKGLTKVFRDAVQGFFESIFGPSDEDACVTQYGTIIWTCGKYMMAANDATEEGGNEDEIAAAIYAAAEEDGLCSFGETLVIMADTADRVGAQKLVWPQEMAQRVNQYYGVNSYGTYPPFKFSFRDADGSKGNADWYRVDQPLNTFAGAGGASRFGAEATKKAFAGSDLPENLYFERIVVVFAGNGKQSDATAIFSNLCSYKDNSYYVEVDAALGKRKIYTKNFILLSENRELGGWVHEFGHSMPSKHMMPGGFARISDRYNYNGQADRQYGLSGYWDLMGSGSHWGPSGSTPTQMASFTKNAAEWLTYRYAAINGTYALTALENMQKGSAVLIIDDPTSNNAENYFIVEARDSATAFGAPESGVMIYQVQYDTGNAHHIVNYMSNLGAPYYTNSPTNGWVPKPTLHTTAGNNSRFLNPVQEFKVTLESQTANPYTASVKVEEYKPNNVVGAVAGPAGGPAVNGTNDAASTENDLPGTMPDIDLHAYDSSGRHTGVNYATMQYESNIPGAIFSGDLKDAPEWIFVPAGTKVRFEISAYKTEKFLEKYPQLAPTARPQEYETTMIKFDSEGVRTEADAGVGQVAAGQTANLPEPDDPTLVYTEPGTKPGFNENQSSNPCCPLPMLLGALAAAAALIGKAA